MNNLFALCSPATQVVGGSICLGPSEGKPT
jgi:hypothetical protein